MTQFQSLRSVALITVTAASTMIVMQACGGGAIAQTAVDPIEGVWESSVVIKDCTSGAVVRTFRGEGMFQHGGSLSGGNSLPQATQGIALGNWKQGAVLGYTANQRLLRFNLDGTLAGSQKIQRAITLAADGNSFTGTITAQIIDPAEVVVQSICGSETAVRIY